MHAVRSLRLWALPILLLTSHPLMRAQSAANPLSAGTKGFYGLVKTNLVKAAEKMPEENYAFKATPDVRSFGQIIGHIADSQYAFCGAVVGDKPSGTSVEKTKTAKADLVQSLQDAFTYCDKAYDAMTDAHAAETVKFFGRDLSKLVVLSVNTAHLDEHYGNIVTYMRLKGLVPPSSETK